MSIILYSIHPPEENLQIMPYDTYFDYLINDFLNFCHAYLYRFLYKTSYITIPIVIFWALICFKHKKYSVAYFVLINLISICFFYFAIFLIGHCALDANKYYFDHFRWTLMYVIMLTYLLLLEIGYYIDICVKSDMKNLIKVLFCTIIFIIFSKYLVIDNLYYLINSYIPSYKDNRVANYVIEKLIIENKDNEIVILPKNYKLPNGSNLSLLNSEIGTEVVSYGSVWLVDSGEIPMFNYLRILHYPELENVLGLKFSDEYVQDDNLFTEEEIENLNFQNLLSHPIQKNQIINYSNPPLWQDRFSM